MGLVLLAIGVVGLIMLAMAVGPIFSRTRCLRGSCGGLQPGGADDPGLACDACPMRRPPRRP